MATHPQSIAVEPNKMTPALVCSFQIHLLEANMDNPIESEPGQSTP
jgi:hypothetical protein